jgi:hypothetical protein
VQWREGTQVAWAVCACVHVCCTLCISLVPVWPGADLPHSKPSAASESIEFVQWRAVRYLCTRVPSSISQNFLKVVICALPSAGGREGVAA